VNTLIAQGYTSTNFATIIRENMGDRPTSTPITGPPPLNKFVFRIDDIQDFYQSSSQVNLLNYFIDNKVGVTASIIANAFNGADAAVYTALKKCVSVGPSKCALANRGWDSTYLFNNATSVAAAKTQIQKADTKIKTFFPDYDLLTFVPYQNAWNTFTIQAAAQLGYDAISASLQHYSGMVWSTTPTSDGTTASPTGILQLPQQVSVAYYDSNSHLQANPINEIMNVCNLAANRQQECVILIHSEEVNAGVFTITQLGQLVSTLKSQGFTSTNFPDMITQAKGISSFPTFKPTVAPASVSSASTSSTGKSKAERALSDPLTLVGISVVGFIIILLILKYFGFGIRTCIDQYRNYKELDGRSDLNKDDLITIEGEEGSIELAIEEGRLGRKVTSTSDAEGMMVAYGGRGENGPKMMGLVGGYGDDKYIPPFRSHKSQQSLLSGGSPNGSSLASRSFHYDNTFNSPSSDYMTRSQNPSQSLQHHEGFNHNH
jgi:hypothetical protein